MTPMCEILLCVKDRGLSGNLLTDSRMPKQGDVLSAQADGYLWGTAELGGPNYTHNIAQNTKKTITVTVSDSSAIVGLKDLRGVDRTKIISEQVSDWIDIPAGKFSFSTPPLLVSPTTATQDFFSYRITGTEIRPISEHENGNHPFWRVIKLTAVSFAAASTLLPPEPQVDPLHPSPYLQYRQKFLDKTKIPPAIMQAFLDHWNDDLRTKQFLTMNVTAAQIMTIVSTRPAIPF